MPKKKSRNSWNRDLKLRVLHIASMSFLQPMMITTECDISTNILGKNLIKTPISIRVDKRVAKMKQIYIEMNAYGFDFARGHRR